MVFFKVKWATWDGILCLEFDFDIHRRYSPSKGDRETAAVDSLVTAESAVMPSAGIPLSSYSWSFYPLPVSLLKFNLPSALCDMTHLPREFTSVFQRDIWLPYMHRNCISSAESVDAQICVCELDLLCIQWLLCVSFRSHGRARINKESIFRRAGQKFNLIVLGMGG